MRPACLPHLPARIGLFLALGVSLLVPNQSSAQGRRFLTTPGIVIETGARHATCDALMFTKDGNQLLAAGDDKVVRTWPVGATSFTDHQSKVFRWPIFREQLGGIHALASNENESKIAIGGFGMKPGMVAVLDRSNGEILHILDNPPTGSVTWVIAFSPKGDLVVYGTEIGEFFAWKPLGGEKAIVKLGKGIPGKINRARLVQFLDDHTVLTVTQDGRIREWDVRVASETPTRERSFRLGSLLRVTPSPDRRWLAGVSELREEGDETDKVKVRLIDYQKLRADANAPDARYEIAAPKSAEVRYPRALAFDETSKFIAVGYAQVNTLRSEVSDFHRVTGGGVHVYSLRKGDWLTPKSLDVGYQVNNIAFRPGHVGQLATAGGPNHEVQLWDYVRAEALDTIRTPGSGMWGVGMTADGKSLAWRERMNPNPQNPNDRATGDWRVFPLAGDKHAITTSAPKDVKLHLPLSTYKGWSVVPGATGFIWSIRDPGGNSIRLDPKNGLYFDNVAQLPRCYTFIPPNPTTKTPLRLAVGHQWGASVYDLEPGKVRLARVLIGHEGEVMSVAASPDGRLLFTASRDQTIACWSLIDWPGQKELGAHFDSSKGKLIVKKVELGSILWELGLTDGDEIVMVVSTDLLSNATGFVYDPYAIGLAKYKLHIGNPTRCDLAEITHKLREAQPWRQYVIVWRHDGKDQVGNRRVQQRPLWRFFPTRKETGSDWILWRWRDYYYDASEQADRLVGWHVNVERPSAKKDDEKEYTATPRFYQMESFRGSPGDAAGKGRHRPDKVWPIVQEAFTSPDKVQIADIEPPSIQLTLVQAPDPKTDLVVRIGVKPLNAVAPDQKIKRVVLWLDDSTYEALPKIGPNGIDAQVRIPPARLRQGVNSLRLVAFNEAGGRGESKPLEVSYKDPTRAKPTLYALCVGIDDYSKAKGGIPNLQCAQADATQVAGILTDHEESGLFDKVDVKLLAGKQATLAKIIEVIEACAKGANPDDLFVLFLAGHGTAEALGGRQYEPGSFAFICHDSDLARPDTFLKTSRLSVLFQKIRGRKLILLDACHSGAIRSSPTRDLTANGERFFILSACKPHEKAREPVPEETGMKHGLFTQGIMASLSPTAAGKKPTAKKGRLVKVTASQLGDTVTVTLKKLLVQLGAEADVQTPVFFPEKLPPIPLLCRP